ncbi:TolB family protein [Haloferula rosea]|uniref:Uncharacterized protein n=1 Tax=Haloferula rosea TaxID=490093 RepID=A0A934RFB7_9BACT|nr:hypothetical protein [Haloferula rosea]MBK1828477.1 hypothetical protein [Haloferula rosea]
MQNILQCSRVHFDSTNPTHQENYSAMRLPHLLAFTALGLIPLHAEVRLLTGDANNQTHESSADIVDLSSDGDWVAIVTGPPVTGSTPGITQGGLHLRQISADTLEYVSGNSGTYVGVGDAAVSDDGRFVAWRSTTNAVSGSSNHAKHVYWRDRQTGTTRLITGLAEEPCNEPKISADGRYVTFSSASRNLLPSDPGLPSTNGRSAVYRYDSQTESLEIVSLASDGSPLTGIGGTTGASTVAAYDLSADGRFVVFTTDSVNAHPDRSANMTAGFLAVCRREISTGTVVMVNRNAAGNVVDGNFVGPRISDDGSRVGFAGSFVAIFKPANPMITGIPANFGNDAFVKDLDTGEVWLASATTDGTAHAGFFGPRFSISSNGSTFAFASSSPKLDPLAPDTDGAKFDVFRVDLGSAGSTTTTLISSSPTNSGNVDYISGPFLAGTGDYLAFNTYQVEEMTGQTSTFSQGVGVGSFPPPAGGLSYASWAAVLPAADQDFTDNPAMDGVDNLTKFMMGMDPTVPDRSQLPASGLSPGSALGLVGDTNDYLTLQVRIRRDLPPGFTWTVRAANTLAGLAAGAGNAIQVGTPTADGDFDLYLFRFPTPTSAVPGTGFMDVLLTGS